jgi:hypothetical protein
MADMSWEHAAEARAALNAIVTDPEHGVAALSSAQTMSNLLKDLLPDAPREKSMLVAAAEAGLASSLRDHVAQGMDPGTAIRLTASSFSATTPFTPEACNWVAGEIAIALGISTPAQAGGAPAAGGGQFGGAPAGFDPVGQGQATQMPGFGGQPQEYPPVPGFGGGQAQEYPPVPGFGQAQSPGFGQPAAGFGQAPAAGFGQAPAAGYEQAPTQAAPIQAAQDWAGQGYQQGAAQPGGFGSVPPSAPGGYGGAGFGDPAPAQPSGYGGIGSVPPAAPGGYGGGAIGGQPAQPGGYGAGGIGGQPAQPAWQGAGGYGIVGGIPGRPGGPRRSRRGMYVAVSLLVLLIVVIVVAVSVLGGSKKPSAGGSSPPPVVPSDTPTPPPSTSPPPVTSGIEALQAIMNPAGQTPLGRSCVRAITNGLKASTLIGRTFCSKTTAAKTVVWGYQFDSKADYFRGLAHLNRYTGFSASGASTRCPPSGGAADGATGWHSVSNPRYKQRAGQDLECYYDNREPILLWTMPTQHVVFVSEIRTKGASLAPLLKWWRTLSYG